MFSASQSVSATAPPPQPRRRRQRYDSDSLQQQAPPRKRTRIASGHFKPPLNGTHHQANGVENGIASALQNPASKVVPAVSRVNTKPDSTVIMSKTPKYTITSLPSLPDKLSKTSNFRASLRLNNTSHQTIAVAVTSDSVLVWDFLHSASVPKSLTLPYPVTLNHLPLACAVTNSSKHIGLVLVYPDTGKITYWENIHSAESLKLFSHRQGVEGQLKKYGGETITGLVDTEAFGIILLTDYGRVALASLQDSYGNPQVVASFLPGQANANLLTSIASSFSSGWISKVHRVNCRQLPKGRLQIMALDEQGSFKVWIIPEAGQAAFSGQFEFATLARESLLETGLIHESQRNIKFLDFSQVRTISEDQDSVSDEFTLHSVMVVRTDHRVFILELMITPFRQSIYRILPITNAFKTTTHDHLSLFFSPQEETITLVQGISFAIISWPLPKDSVEDDPVKLVYYFQDTITCSERKSGGAILAVANENRSTPRAGTKKAPANSLFIFTKSGLIKLTPNAYPNPKTLSPSAENKLEQIVFFGTSPDNILHLQDISTYAFAPQDIEAAAVRLSSNIVATACEHLPQSAPSLEQHLKLRTDLLQYLANYLRLKDSSFSRSSRWKLIFDAEKLAAARAIWRAYDAKVTNEKASKETSLFEEAVGGVLPEGENANNETDAMRIWFTKYIPSLAKLFPSCCKIIEATNLNDQLHTESFLHFAQSMNDLIVHTLGTAYDFRRRHLTLYGLEHEAIEQNGLLTDYKNLPKFWTSDAGMNTAVGWSLKLSRQIVTGILYKADDPKALVPKVIDQAVKLASSMDVVVRLSCKSHMENYQWLLCQDNEQERNAGIVHKEEFETEIRAQIVGLYEMGQSQRGLLLAEELENIPSLVELSLLELDVQKATQAEFETPLPELVKIENQIEHYFKKFGTKFAEPFYRGQISTHRLGDLLTKAMGTDVQKSKFLRSDSKYAKLSWINDAITDENSMITVGNSLMVAEENEENVWSKGVELALAKLALRSVPGSREPSVVQNSENPQNTAFADAIAAHQLLVQNSRQLTIWKTQQKLFAHVRGSIIRCIDKEAAIKNCMHNFGVMFVSIHHAHKELLRMGFNELILRHAMSAEYLVDMLTLMDEGNTDDLEDSEFWPPGTEMNLAIQVLNHADIESEMHDMMNRLIWKRCIVRDDWTEIGKNDYKSDRTLDERLIKTAVYLMIKRGLSESLKLSTLFPIPSASSLLGAGSSPSDYEHRFPNNEEIRIQIAKDNAIDDKLLQGYLNTAAMQELLTRITELAQFEVEAEATESAEKAARFASYNQRFDDRTLDVDSVSQEDGEVMDESYDDVSYDDDVLDDADDGTNGEQYGVMEGDEGDKDEEDLDEALEIEAEAKGQARYEGKRELEEPEKPLIKVNGIKPKPVMDGSTSEDTREDSSDNASEEYSTSGNGSDEEEDVSEDTQDGASEIIEISD